MLESQRPLVLLAEGCLTPLEAKTAVGLLRYRPERVAAVLDSTRAGRRASECVGVGGDIPVVGDLAAAAQHGARALLIGIAPAGGILPERWRALVREALRRGWEVISGLHQFLGDDAEFMALAREHGGSLLDVRRPPAGTPLASGRAAALEALVVLTIGSDCNIGKMTAALEITRALSAAGERAEFVATGQTGIMIAGGGAAIDAVPADFAAGVAERLVVEAAARADFVVVEGQGALRHPAFSGVSLALLHGAAPAALVLCHEAGRDQMRSLPPGEWRAIPTLTRLRDEVERAAELVSEARVVAVALNTRELDEAAARQACARAAAELGVPASDPVRFGADALARAILAARDLRSSARGAGTATSGARRAGAVGAEGRHAPRA
jgi:uncharacterized NAD-dependent epimerase/dehydratase family protein